MRITRREKAADSRGAAASIESRWTAVAALGQSVWYDHVARPGARRGSSGTAERPRPLPRPRDGRDVESVDLRQAVLDSDAYDDELAAASVTDSDAQVFERCWIEDIQRACDLVRPVWDAPGDGTGTSRSRRRPSSRSRLNSRWRAHTS